MNIATLQNYIEYIYIYIYIYRERERERERERGGKYDSFRWISCPFQLTDSK